MRARAAVAGALVLGWNSGCWLDDAPIEDLGRTEDGLSPPAAAIPEKQFMEQLDPGLEGRWVGYVEDPSRPGDDGRLEPAVFPSGSREVTLDYRFEFEDEIPRPAATLTFGAGPAPVPEQGVAYPPGVNHYFRWLGRHHPKPFSAPVVEGFEYPLTESDARFADYDPHSASLLTFVQLAPFEQWCNVQEGRPRGGGYFDCLGEFGLAGGDPTMGIPCIVTRADGSLEEVDCNFAAMCSSDLCVCNEYGCGFTYTEGESHLETVGDVFLERQGDELIGTISGATLDSGYPGWYSPMGTLHLQRVGD
jgi:hypothetical protein